MRYSLRAGSQHPLDASAKDPLDGVVADHMRLMDEQLHGDASGMDFGRNALKDGRTAARTPPASPAGRRQGGRHG